MVFGQQRNLKDFCKGWVKARISDGQKSLIMFPIKLKFLLHITSSDKL